MNGSTPTYSGSWEPMLASVTPRQDAFLGADRVLPRVQDDAHDWPLRPERPRPDTTASETDPVS